MKDPVCDMEVTEKNDASEYEGKVYHFCCASCKMAFEQNPIQFIKE